MPGKRPSVKNEKQYEKLKEKGMSDERGRERVTVDPYAWNEGAVRAWGRAGFVEISRHEADEEHTAPWILMEFRG